MKGSRVFLRATKKEKNYLKIESRIISEVTFAEAVAAKGLPRIDSTRGRPFTKNLKNNI